MKPMVDKKQNVTKTKRYGNTKPEPLFKGNIAGTFIEVHQGPNKKYLKMYRLEKDKTGNQEWLKFVLFPKQVIALAEALPDIMEHFSKEGESDE